MTETAEWQRAAGRGRQVIRWINRKPSRAFVIYSLVLVTLVYVAFGILLATTESGWEASDTFSMIAGCVFFVIGTSLAVTHEIRQEEQETLSMTQSRILTDQGRILDEVKELAGKTFEHLSQDLEKLPSRPREVHDIEPTQIQGHGTAAVAIPQSARVPEVTPSEDMSEDMSELADLANLSPIDLAEESLRVYEGSADEQMNVLQRFALESAIEAHADSAAVQDLLKQAQVFTLGTPAGDTSIPGHGTESDILHFAADTDQGKERVFMPLFTRFDVLRAALVRNPDWEELSVLENNGGDLLANRDKDVTLVVNPWSTLEWQLPAEKE